MKSGTHIQGGKMMNPNDFIYFISIIGSKC